MAIRCPGGRSFFGEISWQAFTNCHLVADRAGEQCYCFDSCDDPDPEISGPINRWWATGGHPEEQE